LALLHGGSVSDSAEAKRPRLLGVGAAWLAERPRGARAGGAVVDTLIAASKDGWRCGMLSLRGGDSAGSRLARSIAGRGIHDLGVVYLDRETPVERSGGDRTTPAFGLYEFGFSKQLRRRHFRDAAANADAIVVDTSLPEAALARLLQNAKIPVVAVESELGDAARLRPFLPDLAAVVLHEAILRRTLGLTRTASLGTIAGALAKAGATGVVIAVGEAVSFRFAGGSATLSRPARTRVGALAAAAAAELAALRSAA
jgi:sugar/nucleoside kinase (ribokinase family)